MATTPLPSAGSDPTAALLGQLYDLWQGASGVAPRNAETAAAAADPFAPYRGRYQEQLQQLLTDPSSFKADPGYQFAKEQGLEAVSRAGNAKFGTQRAGAIPIELEKYATGFAAQNYDNRITQLMRMAGVDSGAPGTAGTILAGGFDRQQTDLASGAGGLSSLLSLLNLGGGSMSSASPILSMLRGLLGGGGGFGVDQATGNINYGDFTGSGDQGGWPGDTTGFDYTGGSDWTSGYDLPWSGGGDLSLDSILSSGDYGPW